ncbi:MAG TPA: protoporphyrinogen oxidase [Kiritimatiellia bacterium]|nr:protoporphyrinogen oxidase [Kiritimatiellia bacterium]
MKHITIIGGGITGLAGAFYLQREIAARGLAARYTLVEAGPRWGGKIVTEREREFTIEGGPDSFIVEKPAGLQLCHDVGLGDDLIPSNEIEKRVYVLRNGRLVPFPTGFRLTIPTQLMPFVFSPLISPVGKLRMAGDFVLPRRRETGDESLGSFIRRRFGRECLDRIAGPLLGGIFVSDPERLSMQATFPRLQAMEREYGSLIRAARAVRRLPRPTGGPRAAGTAMFNSLRHGMGSLVEAVTRKLDGDLRLNSPIRSITWREGRAVIQPETGEGWTSDAVIATTPAAHTAALLEQAHPTLAANLRAFRYVSTATISLAYLLDDIPRERPLDGFGVMIPACEGRSLIAITWASTKFRHRAPDGCVLIRTFVGGHTNEAMAGWPEDELLAVVRRELESILGIRAEPLFHRIYRWSKANPQYDVGHLDRVAELERAAATLPGLHLAGSSYRGVGIPDCVQGARKAVEALAAKL